MARKPTREKSKGLRIAELQVEKFKQRERQAQEQARMEEIRMKLHNERKK